MTYQESIRIFWILCLFNLLPKQSESKQLCSLISCSEDPDISDPIYLTSMPVLHFLLFPALVLFAYSQYILNHFNQLRNMKNEVFFTPDVLFYKPICRQRRNNVQIYITSPTQTHTNHKHASCGTHSPQNASCSQWLLDLLTHLCIYLLFHSFIKHLEQPTIHLVWNRLRDLHMSNTQR